MYIIVFFFDLILINLQLERIRSELKLLEDQKHSLVNQVKEFNHEETKIRYTLNLL